MNAATFAAVFIAWWVAHSLGDHWVQTSCQSNDKGLRTRRGVAACLRHVVGLQLTKAVTLALVWVLFGLALSPGWVLVAWLLDGVTHYWADRRYTLRALADKLGKLEFYDLGADTKHADSYNGSHIGTGKYALDQSWHHAWLFVSALVACI